MAALHHLALGARDVEALACFYQDIFELERLQTHHDDHGKIRSVWLDLRPGILMIEKSVHQAQRLEPMALGQGPFLLAFSLDEKGEYRFLNKLKSHQISLEGRTPATLYFRDLENNRVAVSAYPTPFI